MEFLVLGAIAAVTFFASKHFIANKSPAAKPITPGQAAATAKGVPLPIVQGGTNAAPGTVGPKPDQACTLANTWYEQTPVHNYIPRTVWYQMPCYKRVEAAANPVYFLNAEGVRIVGDLVGITGVDTSTPSTVAQHAGQAVQSTYDAAKKRFGI